jgi:hypothetical protein
VNYPGKYVLASKKAKVYDIVKSRRFDFSNIEGVKIKRPIQAKQIEAVESINLNLGKKTVSKINWRKTERRFEIRHHTCGLEVDC